MKKFIICTLFAFFTLYNTSADKAIMRLWWFDHGFDEFPIPSCFITAEVGSGEKYVGGNNYNGESFGAEVDSKYRELVKTHKGEHRIIVTWDGNEIRY